MGFESGSLWCADQDSTTRATTVSVTVSVFWDGPFQASFIFVFTTLQSVLRCSMKSWLVLNCRLWELKTTVQPFEANFKVRNIFENLSMDKIVCQKSLSTIPETSELFYREVTDFGRRRFFCEKNFFSPNCKKTFFRETAFPHFDLSGWFVQTFNRRKKNSSRIFFGAKMKFFSLTSLCVFSFLHRLGMFFSISVKQISSETNQQVSRRRKLRFARFWRSLENVSFRMILLWKLNSIGQLWGI